MEGLTWGELKKLLEGLTPEQLDQNVTVHDGEEFHPMNTLAITDETDVLDAGHPYLFYF